eukprot:2131730-Prymnesium_polylepis.1
MPPKRSVPDQRGGDTSDTMYRIVSLYRCIGVSLMYRLPLHPEACQERYDAIQCIGCITTRGAGT